MIKLLKFALIIAFSLMITACYHPYNHSRVGVYSEYPVNNYHYSHNYGAWRTIPWGRGYYNQNRFYNMRPLQHRQKNYFDHFNRGHSNMNHKFNHHVNNYINRDGHRYINQSQQNHVYARNQTLMNRGRPQASGFLGNRQEHQQNNHGHRNH